jgi:hypothetical protein
MASFIRYLLGVVVVNVLAVGCRPNGNALRCEREYLESNVLQNPFRNVVCMLLVQRID